jgi:DNA-directed RNA polymerase subunit RPC12/RpoP
MQEVSIPNRRQRTEEGVIHMNKERIIRATELLLRVVKEEAPNCPLCGIKMLLDMSDELCDFGGVRIANYDDDIDSAKFVYRCGECFSVDMKMDVTLE